MLSCRFLFRVVTSSSYSLVIWFYQCAISVGQYHLIKKNSLQTLLSHKNVSIGHSTPAFQSCTSRLVWGMSMVSFYSKDYD